MADVSDALSETSATRLPASGRSTRMNVTVPMRTPLSGSELDENLVRLERAIRESFEYSGIIFERLRIDWNRMSMTLVGISKASIPAIIEFAPADLRRNLIPLARHLIDIGSSSGMLTLPGLPPGNHARLEKIAESILDFDFDSAEYKEIKEHEFQEPVEVFTVASPRDRIVVTNTRSIDTEESRALGRIASISAELDRLGLELESAVEAARFAGASWNRIAKSLGVTVQSAHGKWAKRIGQGESEA